MKIHQIGWQTYGVANTNLQDIFEKYWVAFLEGYFESIGIITIGKQVKIPGKGFIDFLGLDESGKTVIIKLKKEEALFESIEQATENASWIENYTNSDFDKIFEKYKQNGADGKSNLSESFNSLFSRDIPKNLSKSHHLLIVVDEPCFSLRREAKRISDKLPISVLRCNELLNGNILTEILSGPKK